MKPSKELVSDLKEFLSGIELETSKGESFSLRYAVSEDCCIDQLAQAIAERLCSGEIKDGNISDGYHTFNELYDHRCLLWINLILLQHPKMCYLVEEHFKGWFLLGIETPKGQLSYHIPNKYLNLCAKIERRQPEYDGHTSYDVCKRLIDLALSTTGVIRVKDSK